MRKCHRKLHIHRLLQFASRAAAMTVIAVVVMMMVLTPACSGIHGSGHHQSVNYAKRLYNEKLNSEAYNKLIRPVGNTSDTLTVRIGLRLVAIIDIVSIYL